MLTKEFIVVGLHTLTLLAVIGFLAYTKFFYKKPVLNEEKEYAALLEKYQEVTQNSAAYYVEIKKLNIHLKNQTTNAKQTNEKDHYLQLGLALEVTTEETKQIVSEFIPMITDKIIEICSKKKLFELATVQGRYSLAAELTEAAHNLIAPHANKQQKVVNVYFNDFLLQ
jgi:flagellar basal body-associated protein FliL